MGKVRRHGVFPFMSRCYYFFIQQFNLVCFMKLFASSFLSYREAPAIYENASKIIFVICGYLVKRLKIA